jgi:hypothetical protein
LAHGFLDPLSVIARLQQFAEPSEVAEPIELLRAGVTFHARGLINSRVIQHNLDWVWPFWIHRQFDPLDPAFLPRAFSITHCNLSHRNWTAIGWPDSNELPLIDPRGLLTPHFDSWSIDVWLIAADGTALFPSQCDQVEQQLEWREGMTITTDSSRGNSRLINQARVELRQGKPVCCVSLTAHANTDAKLVIALRPYNPEGISFIQHVVGNGEEWEVNHTHRLKFNDAPDQQVTSDYRAGDVSLALTKMTGNVDTENPSSIEQQCDVGMATAAALFETSAQQSRRISLEIPLPKTEDSTFSANDWDKELEGLCKVQIPNSRMQFLFESAVRTLILHSPGDVYPGSYTYKRFWFRDAAFILQAMLHVGLSRRVERAIDRFPLRQKHNGFFHSQDGEWDSNGEALWIIDLYTQFTQQPLKSQWRDMVAAGAQWIINKRLRDTGDSPMAGLLPPGFSAEHLGPNDYYYWDDFWGAAGLQSAASLCRSVGALDKAKRYQQHAQEFQDAITRSLQKVETRIGIKAMPASPNRRLDSGAIGSLVAGYPLQLYTANDPRLTATVEFLYRCCFVNGGFFQDMIHSGINAYLTLHVAQVMARAGDDRCFELMTRISELATVTGQWPEAIHPKTGGGCMGDGEHVWAAAEWIVMLRNCFIREEGQALILGSGIPITWLQTSTQTQPLVLGPAPTKFGPITVCLFRLAEKTDAVRVEWQSRWHHAIPAIEVHLPGCDPVPCHGGTFFTKTSFTKTNCTKTSCTETSYTQTPYTQTSNTESLSQKTNSSETYSPTNKGSVEISGVL